MGFLGDHRSRRVRPAPAPQDLGDPHARDRRRRILALLASEPQLTRKLVAERLPCAPLTAARDLAWLQTHGHLRRHAGPGRRFDWFTAP